MPPYWETPTLDCWGSAAQGCSGELRPPLPMDQHIVLPISHRPGSQINLSTVIWMAAISQPAFMSTRSPVNLISEVLRSA